MATYCSEDNEASGYKKPQDLTAHCTLYKKSN